MRPFCLTLLPMFALAVFTAVVGERLSQRESEEHVPVDRERLLDFSSALAEELDRLQALYKGHLDYLARHCTEGNGREVEKYIEGMWGVRSVSLFSPRAKRKSIEPFGKHGESPAGDSDRGHQHS